LDHRTGRLLADQSSWLRRKWRTALIATAAAAALFAGGIAYADTAQPAIKTITPRSENQITNLDVLRQQIRNYGDPLGTGTFAPDSNYAKEATTVAKEGKLWLKLAFLKRAPKKAIILDVDDTSLATWSYEISSNWAFNLGTNGAAVLGQIFPAVPGMVDLATTAAKEGYAIFFLTGRGAGQEAATLGNLTADNVGVDAGFPIPHHALRRGGRPVHQASRGRLPGLPEDGLRRRPERLVHHDPLQVRHPGPHRVARLRDRRQLR
jgi:hypothetical protein